MKRILALSLSAALLLALLGACTGADPETTVISPDPAGESVTVPPTSAPSPEPSESPSVEPSEEPQPTDSPSHHPEETHHVDSTHHPEETHHGAATPAPTRTPAPKPTPAPTPAPTPTPAPSPTVPGGGIILPGPGGTEEPTAEPSQSGGGNLEPTGPSASDVNLSGFYDSVISSGYAFPPMEVLPTDFIANMFPGLASIPAVQRVVSVPMMSGTASALVLVQVTNSSDVSAVKAIFQDHVNTQIARNANYPAVVDAYQNNTQIVSHDSYVMLVVHESCDAIVSQFNALF